MIRRLFTVGKLRRYNVNANVSRSLACERRNHKSSSLKRALLNSISRSPRLGSRGTRTTSRTETHHSIPQLTLISSRTDTDLRGLAQRVEFPRPEGSLSRFSGRSHRRGWRSLLLADRAPTPSSWSSLVDSSLQLTPSTLNDPRTFQETLSLNHLSPMTNNFRETDGYSPSPAQIDSPVNSRNRRHR